MKRTFRITAFIVQAVAVVVGVGLLFAAIGTVQSYLGGAGIAGCVLTGFVTAVPLAFGLLLFHTQWLSALILVVWGGASSVGLALGHRLMMKAR